MLTTLLTPSQRRHLLSSDAHYRTKLNLRLTSIILSITSLSLFSASIPTWNKNFFHASGPALGDWTDALVLAPLASALLLDTFSIHYTLHISRRASPKLSLACETLIFLSLTITLILAGVGSLFAVWQTAVPTPSGEIPCKSLLNLLSRECSPILYQVGSLQLAGVVCGSLVWLLHSGFAVWSYVDMWKKPGVTCSSKDIEWRHDHRRGRQRHQHRHRHQHQYEQRTATRFPIRTATRQGFQEMKKDGNAYETYGWYR